jgi:FkbM family methyltransferase
MNNIANKNTEQFIIDALFALTQISGFPKNIIDVGANSNATISTPFIQLGWSALLIEPQQSCIQILQDKFNTHSSVDIVRCGCSDIETVLRLYYAKEGEGSELATFSQSNDPWMSMVRDKEHYEEIAVRRLSDILKTKPNFKDVGILKIDTESYDYKVLLGFDFDKHRPKIIVTEEYLWNVEDVIGKHKLLEKAHYICLGWSGYNTFWVCGEYFNFSWSDIGLLPWLKGVNKVASPFESLPFFHDIKKLLGKSRYWDGGLSEMDLLISARDINSLPGVGLSVPVVVSNFGLMSIPSLPQLSAGKQIYLSYHIKSLNDYLLWDGIRTSLNEDIQPNQSVVLQMNFVAPSMPGIYYVEIDLVVEGEAWFSSVSNSRNCYSVKLIVSDDI